MDGYVLFLTLSWPKAFAVKLIVAPPTVYLEPYFHLFGGQTGAERRKAVAKGCLMGNLCAASLQPVARGIGHAICAKYYAPTTIFTVFLALSVFLAFFMVISAWCLLCFGLELLVFGVWVGLQRLFG